MRQLTQAGIVRQGRKRIDGLVVHLQDAQVAESWKLEQCFKVNIAGQQIEFLQPRHLRHQLKNGIVRKETTTAVVLVAVAQLKDAQVGEVREIRHNVGGVVLVQIHLFG